MQDDVNGLGSGMTRGARDYSRRHAIKNLPLDDEAIVVSTMVRVHCLVRHLCSKAVGECKKDGLSTNKYFSFTRKLSYI
jgi:hypothetical protein